jgi:undecaprenyl diphosphate synthase
MSKSSNSAGSSLPRHVAVVMDGNGRWANKRHLPRAAGHKAGVKATRAIVENCAKKGIEALTIFAFSSENWNRPKDEVSSLMSLFVSTITAEVKKLDKMCECALSVIVPGSLRSCSKASRNQNS